MKFITETEAYDRYDEMIDETCDTVQIGSLQYDPSHVLKNVDPTAYRCGFVDYLDSMDLTTDPTEAEPEYEVSTWFERDRQHVEVRNTLTDATVMEWWDEDVTEAVEDGFLDASDWEGSAIAYVEGRNP
jgi:hypothetical protein